MEVVSEARVFDRGRIGEEDWAKEDGEIGDVGGNENAGCDGERLAETSEP
jgi:hypothetical protein